MDPSFARWKKYLRNDPTRWLLETNDPSILLWYQLDIAHRPQDAPAVIETRERVLYSDPVQAIFAAQNELGFWSDPQSLAQPYYRATLWNLALLAELGIPRTSRRARSACEFVLQNFLQADGTFGGLNGVELGYLLHALAYFGYAQDSRIQRAARQLIEYAAQPQASDALRIAGLWGIQEIAAPDAETYTQRDETLDRIHTSLGQRTNFGRMSFPQFDSSDPLFALRVLVATEYAGDLRVDHIVDQIIAKQDEQARWTVERDLNAQLLAPLERADEPSRWMTLNALRVIVKIIEASG